MKNLYAVTRYFLLAFGTLFLQTSCLHEDTDDCLPDTTEDTRVRILVKTLAETESVPTGSYEIDNVSIYIFDEDKHFLDIWEGAAYTYGQDYAAQPDLAPGLYHFVVWTNQGELYDKSNPTYGPDDPAEELVISLQYPSNTAITDDVPDLHHGMLTDAEVVAGTDNEFTVVIRPNTYRLNFTVGGLTVTDNEYAYTVRDDNSHYTFDNAILEQQQELEYVRVTNFTEDDLAASMKVLRLAADRTPRFQFSNRTTGRLLHEDNLVDMIKTAYDSSEEPLDFDRIFEFDIHLQFDAKMGVTVTVNGWSYSHNGTEL